MADVRAKEGTEEKGSTRRMRSLKFEKQRQVNEILKELDLTYLSPRMLAKPLQGWIRISTACDLACPFCERQYIHPVDSGFMDFDEFRRLAETLEGVQKVHLFGLGDPFLSKRFFEYVALCHARGAEVSTTTHGMHVNESLARRIIESGMEEISFSIDAATPELFNRLRKGADFDLVCNHLRQLNDLKRALGSDTPEVVVCCTTSTENVHELDAVVRLVHRLGSRHIFLSDLIPAITEHIACSVYNTEVAQENIAKAVRVGEELGIEVNYFHHNPNPFTPTEVQTSGQPHGCGMAWTNLVVDRQGTTKFCCYIKDTLPSAFGCSIHEAMNSTEHEKNRQQLIDGDLRTECQGCPNLFVNHPDHVFGLLNHVRDLIAESSLDEATRAELTRRVEDYHQKACHLFQRPSNSTPDGSFRQWVRNHVPGRIRAAVRRGLSLLG